VENVPAQAPATPTLTPPPANPPAELPVKPVTSTNQVISDTVQNDNHTPIVTFNISGGLIGFCDQLTVNPDGSYRLQRLCDQNEVSGTLTQEDRASLQAWSDNLRDFQLAGEDNPGSADSLITSLVFHGRGEAEADERQQQVIFDWASGLIVRLRPQEAEPTPTPLPVAAGPGGLCPEISRPALLTIDVENPDKLFIIDPNNQAHCEIALSPLPTGRIAIAAGEIYYPVFEPESKMVSVLRLKANGERWPLNFTSMPMTEPGPFDFLISPDGAKIAWSQTVISSTTDPPSYRNSLWLAGVDGVNQVAILDQVENNERRFVMPIRFSTDGSQLYYALQPDIGGPAFSGRYDTLYRVASNGGETQLIYACPAEENPICIGGVSPDGRILTIVQSAEATLQIIDLAGQTFNSVPLPATDYVERTAFAPNGNLAFVTATLSAGSEGQPPTPNPGYISFLAAPYTGQPQILLSDNSVGTLWGWLDDSRLVFGAIGPEGQTRTVLLNLEGQATELSPHIAIGILR
jgi:hypothetical protein